MKRLFYGLTCFVIAGAFIACAGNKSKSTDAAADTKTVPTVPEYVVVDKPSVDLSKFKVDKDGYIVLFDGKSLEGWRGYGKDTAPERWTIDDGAIRLSGASAGESQDGKGGDLLFAHKFKNFEFEFEWKISKGGNSGVLYLAQEIQSKNPDTGELQWEHVYISAPEAQVLDNANHPDAKLGVNNNRQSMSLYDMIPANPQNAKPFGEWNKSKIMIYKGTVVHNQNDVNVLEYHLWTPEWTKLLQESKFSQEKWPLAFELLNNCGGPNKEGYIVFQDHGDDVWYRNIRIKILE
ncbi:hypothetical protein EZS27_012599 [termite gut metagenome]|uniref:3-keto-alpha-glucoside-1,2-lyase/3-keto-2-hydroxy-glucal hydratase domain-containing protein n=1 Tax=termite gut metagenome TaxID=433724 RepID=A0A5J4S1U8_9ZZZZ